MKMGDNFIGKTRQTKITMGIYVFPYQHVETYSV